MPTITRHPVDPELVEEGIEGDGALLSSLVGKLNAGGLSILLNTARRLAGFEAVSDDGDAPCDALRTGAQAAAAIFALATGTGETEITVAGKKASLTATGPTDAAHVGNWRIGWWLANIVGDRQAVATLLTTPIDVLRRSSSRADECQYLFVEALQAFDRHDEDWSAKLKAALDATDPEVSPLIDEDFVLNIIVPEMQMLYQLAIGEPEPLADATRFALERHKKYWSKASRKRDAEGYLALGPLALLVIGREAGITVDVASDYIPQAIVEGDCNSRHA